MYLSLINNRLSNHCEENDLIVDEQKGFRKDRSCLDHLYVISSVIRNRLMKGQSEIAYLPKFANMMLIVMVIVITEILYIILIFDCFENR